MNLVMAKDLQKEGGERRDQTCHQRVGENRLQRPAAFVFVAVFVEGVGDQAADFSEGLLATEARDPERHGRVRLRLLHNILTPADGGPGGRHGVGKKL